MCYVFISRTFGRKHNHSNTIFCLILLYIILLLFTFICSNHFNFLISVYIVFEKRLPDLWYVLLFFNKFIFICCDVKVNLLFTSLQINESKLINFLDLFSIVIYIYIDRRYWYIIKVILENFIVYLVLIKCSENKFYNIILLCILWFIRGLSK